MNLEDLTNSFRVDSDDESRAVSGGDGDLLWPAEDVTRWLNEGVDEAALRKRLLFEDVLPAMCRIDVLVGQSAYPLHPALIDITAAFVTRPDGGRPCQIFPTDRIELDRVRHGWRFERCEFKDFIQEDKRIVLPGIVDEPRTLRLEGYRLPLNPLVGDSDEPEIANTHHRFLVHWALHRAYGKQDADTFDPKRSALELTKFEDYFGPRPDADLRKDQHANRPHFNKAW
ncbi:phage adaptor protein [Variovorax boronicumulans]|uniref:phage adaptor protein n=1 Tax=Variovorax boronicumulans TaxID=436515 RepID=UPI0012E5BF37|nr:hypothetical protein [Variovorax boronicumulans]GER16682.1 hypothetical protein VCH24_16880 [Variovorax boronicumulans]